MSKLTYDDFKQRLSIQDVLIDAGYTLNRRDGLRYPSYVKLDSDGRRIRGDKFIVTANGLCCFQPPTIKNYNVIGFIKEHPELFQDYTPGMDKDRLVNLVCNRLLNNPVEEREQKIVDPKRDMPPFRIEDYTLHEFKGDDRETQKVFYPFFKSRGLDLNTQYAFHKDFVLAEHTTKNGKSFKNLSFIMRIPGKDDIVGFEERGRQNKDGKAYKGMALGSNASEGLWMSSPNKTALKDAKLVFVFESAYDAMAFYQILAGKNSDLLPNEKKDLKDAIYASTGGNPSVGQMRGLILNAPNATFHLAFDNDLAGKQFVMNFKDAAKKLEENHKVESVKIIREEPDDGYKDFNDQLLDKKQYSLTDVIETALDEDGEDLTVEEKDENEDNEEEKHHGFKR